MAIYYGELRMENRKISYNKLWKLLIDKKITKADLRKAVKMSPNTMTKMTKDEEVSMGISKTYCPLIVYFKSNSNNHLKIIMENVPRYIPISLSLNYSEIPNS